MFLLRRVFGCKSLDLLEWQRRERLSDLASSKLRRPLVVSLKIRLSTHLKTRDEILRAHPLLDYIQRQGVRVKGAGPQRISNRCPLKQHKPDHWCVSINVDEQIFHCNDCDCGGSVID